MSKQRKIWIGCGAALALAAIIYISITVTRRDEVVVQTSKVARKDELKSKVSASGEIRAKEFVDIQAEVAGVVKQLPVREGDSVTKGQVLLTIDTIQNTAETAGARAQLEASRADAQSQQFQIMNAESNLTRDEAILRSAQAELEQAQTNYARIQNTFRRKQQLHEDGLISREEYEMAQSDFKVSKAQLDVANARLAQMRTQVQVSQNNIEQMKSSYAAAKSRTESVAANFARAEDMLQKTTIYSPLNGVITQLLVEAGERAVPGMPYNPQATLMTIADLSVIQAEIRVDETDIVNLALGQEAEVKVDALPDVVFKGEVTEIGNSPIQTGAAAQQEAKDFKVKVTLKEPSPKLRPGMSCTGEIITSTKTDLLVVPIQALTIREVEVDKDGKYHQPDLKNKKVEKEPVAHADSSREKPKKKELEGVFVINKDRLARFRPVKTGITGESEIEIFDLAEGDEVVSGSFQTLRTIKDGTPVKIDNSATKKSESKS